MLSPTRTPRRTSIQTSNTTSAPCATACSRGPTAAGCCRSATRSPTPTRRGALVSGIPVSPPLGFGFEEARLERSVTSAAWAAATGALENFEPLWPGGEGAHPSVANATKQVVRTADGSLLAMCAGTTPYTPVGETVESEAPVLHCVRRTVIAAILDQPAEAQQPIVGSGGRGRRLVRSRWLPGRHGATRWRGAGRLGRRRRPRGSLAAAAGGRPRAAAVGAGARPARHPLLRLRRGRKDLGGEPDRGAAARDGVHRPLLSAPRRRV